MKYHIFLLLIITSQIYAANVNYAGFTYDVMNQYIQDCKNTYQVTCTGTLDANNPCVQDLISMGMQEDVSGVDTTIQCFNSQETSHPCYIWRSTDSQSAEQLVDYSARACFDTCFSASTILRTQSSDTQYSTLLALQKCLYDIKEQGFMMKNFPNYNYFDLNTIRDDACADPMYRGCTSGTDGEFDGECATDKQRFDQFFNQDPSTLDACTILTVNDQWTKDTNNMNQWPNDTRIVDSSILPCAQQFSDPSNYQSQAYKDYTQCVYNLYQSVFIRYDPFERKYGDMEECQDSLNDLTCDGEDGERDSFCEQDLKTYHSRRTRGSCRWANFVTGGDYTNIQNTRDMVLSDYAIYCLEDDYFQDYKGTHINKQLNETGTCFKKNYKMDNPRGLNYGQFFECTKSQDPNLCRVMDEHFCDNEMGEDGELCRDDYDNWINSSKQEATNCWIFNVFDLVEGEYPNSEIIDLRYYGCINSFEFKTQRFRDWQKCNLDCMRNHTVISSGITKTRYDQCLVENGCTSEEIDCAAITDQVQRDHCMVDKEAYWFEKHKGLCYYNKLIDGRITGDQVYDASYAACHYKAYQNTFRSQAFNQRSQCEISCIQDLFPGVASFLSGALLNFAVVLATILLIIVL